MRVLLGSGGFRSEERRANLHAEMRDFFGETVEEVLFIPYALHDHEAYTKAMREDFLEDLRLLKEEKNL